MNNLSSKRMDIRHISLRLPIYFPSISSVKTSMPPQDYLELLSRIGYINQQFLVSAFDLNNIQNKEKVLEIFNKAKESRITILMDSGNYESFWKDKKESWKQSDFHQMLKVFPCDMAFSFDEQNPPDRQDKHADLIIRRWEADQNAAEECKIIPIIHATQKELPALSAEIARRTGVAMLAVPERRLGDGIVERAKTIKKIRTKLDDTGRYVALHLLGTGNPTSIAWYVSMGADSFDGLEWCQTVVDHETGLLYHFAQADFFTKQTEWLESKDLSFQARTLVHNLEFFVGWMNKLRRVREENNLLEFCSSHLGNNAFQTLKDIAGWE